MSSTVIFAQSIPVPLRKAITERREAAIELQCEICRGLSPKAFRLIDRVADLNRSLRAREWLPRIKDFDPIAMGM